MSGADEGGVQSKEVPQYLIRQLRKRNQDSASGGEMGPHHVEHLWDNAATLASSDHEKITAHQASKRASSWKITLLCRIVVLGQSVLVIRRQTSAHPSYPFPPAL